MIHSEARTASSNLQASRSPTWGTWSEGRQRRCRHQHRLNACSLVLVDSRHHPFELQQHSCSLNYPGPGSQLAKNGLHSLHVSSNPSLPRPHRSAPRPKHESLAAGSEATRDPLIRGYAGKSGLTQVMITRRRLAEGRHLSKRGNTRRLKPRMREYKDAGVATLRSPVLHPHKLIVLSRIACISPLNIGAHHGSLHEAGR